MYYWRRRLPNALASWFHRRHLFLSLQTSDPNFARRLVVLLDAKLEEVVTAFEHSEMHLTPPQVDALLRDVVTKHLNKLERLSAAAKSFANFNAAQAERDDRRAAWAYGLLHTQGSRAVVRPTDETQMSAEGMTAVEIAAVQDHLAMLRINDLVPRARNPAKLTRHQQCACQRKQFGVGAGHLFSRNVDGACAI